MPEITIQSIARSFSRLGWIGFWIQAVLAVLPLAMFAYLVFGRAVGTSLEFGFTDYLAFVALAILIFTALWSLRYTLLAKQMMDSERRPAWRSIVRTLWIGLWACVAGLFLSLVLLVSEVTRLMLLLLKAPQGGVPVIRTEAESRHAWVSTMDVVSLMSDLCTLIGELLIISFTLWLLFRMTYHAMAFQTKDASIETDDASTETADA